MNKKTGVTKESERSKSALRWGPAGFMGRRRIGALRIESVMTLARSFPL